MIHQKVERAHADARKIHAQNCHCPRCSPWRRRRTFLQGVRATWRVMDPADRSSIKWGLGLGLGIDGAFLLAHFAPAIAAALRF